MGYYKILSSPQCEKASPSYKGLYRTEPFPPTSENSSYISLWKKYAQYYETDIGHDIKGICDELSLSELKSLSELASRHSYTEYELIYFNTIQDCPFSACYYGIDVVSSGGYSLLGENLFTVSPLQPNDFLFSALNQHFSGKLNQYALFSHLDDAKNFCEVLKNINTTMPNYIEKENWNIVHIFRIL